jgi:O-antigen ligase
LREDFLVAWKFGLAYAITLMALLVSCYFYVRRRHWIYIAISLGMAALNLIFASRSQIAIDLISLTLALPILRQNSLLPGGTGKSVQTFRIVVLLTLACGAAYAANQAIKFGVNHSFFDESIQGKFQSQEEGRLGVLVGGRPETLVAIQAIGDSPLIGHGSFAVDPKYNWLQQDIEYENGYTESDAPPDEEDAGIPAHSHLTQSWVESGIFGGIFWLYALFIASRGILLLISRGSPMAPLYAFLLVGFIWDVLYSPMGSFQRLWGGFAMLTTYNLMKIARMEDCLARKPAITNKWVIQPRKSAIRLRYIGRPYPDQGERRIR